MAKCIQCNSLFESKRSTAKYCSDKCRKLAFQSDAKVSVPELSVPTVLPANFGLENCECRHCKQNRHNKSKHVLNHGAYKPAGQLAANELNRVSLPGDVDYTGAQHGH